MRRFNIKTLESKAEKSSLKETGGRKTGSGHLNRFEYILNFRPNSAIFVPDGRNGNHKIWKEQISQRSPIAGRK